MFESQSGAASAELQRLLEFAHDARERSANAVKLDVAPAAHPVTVPHQRTARSVYRP
jgi:hypothetical protein